MIYRICFDPGSASTSGGVRGWQTRMLLTPLRMVAWTCQEQCDLICYFLTATANADPQVGVNGRSQLSWSSLVLGKEKKGAIYEPRVSNPTACTS